MKVAGFGGIAIAALCAGLLALAPVHAEEAGTGDGWQFAAAVYLWGADIDGETATGSDVDVSFDDLFDNLNAGFMGSFEARNDKWLVLSDLMYLDVSADKTAKATVPVGQTQIQLKAEADVDLKGLVFQLLGGYKLFSDGRSRLNLIGGARYLDLDMDAKVKISAVGSSQSEKISLSGHVWDGVIGVQGNYAMGQRWSLPYYVDIGTGQSDFTWQALAGVNFHASSTLDVVLAYQHLEWDIGGDVVDNINFSGPTLGAIFRF